MDQDGEYEAELENITQGMVEGLDADEDDEGEEPSRPTSAPPTLEISNSNLFAFAAFQTNGQQQEDTFPIISDETNFITSPMGSPFGESVPQNPTPFNNRGDPRKRTQSIEKFLAQSPGSILAPRKRYGLTATGVPRTSGRERDGSIHADADSSLAYLGSESPGQSLRGLRKRLDALNLSTYDSDDQFFLQHQDFDLGGLGGFMEKPASTPNVNQGIRVETNTNVSPVDSNAPTPTAPRSPLHSPVINSVEGSNIFGTVMLGESSADPGNPTPQQQNLEQMHIPSHLQHSDYGMVPPPTHPHPQTYSSATSDQQQMYMRQQGLYMQDPYHHHMHPHLPQHQPMYIQMQSGNMPSAYYSQHHMPSNSYSTTDSSGSEDPRSFVPEMNGLQKVILPNGVEAMVLPMMPWGGGMPPPPPTAPPSAPMDQYLGRDMMPQQRKRGGMVGMKGGERTGMMKAGKGGKNNGNNNHNKGMGEHHGGVKNPDPSTIISASAPLEDYLGSIFQLSQEQNGCRFLQQKVDRDGAVACEIILEEVKNRLVTLMMDPFGNYLFQKLLEHANTEQRQIMLDETRDHLVQAALNLHGTRSVQKFIEVCGGDSPSSGQLDAVIKQLVPHITKMSMDTNGNHVVQRCLQFIPRDKVGFVYDTVVKDVMIITRHRHGCCVFQRCIDAAEEDQRHALVNKVIEHAIELMQDPFGNYVVQYVLDHSQKQEANRVITQLPGRLKELSMQKFSSNVVEKCLQHATHSELEPLIEELCESETMRKFLNDQYANYVVQRALQVADDKQGLRLVQAIRPHMATLASSNASCARRVSSRVIKRFPSLQSDKLFSSYHQKEKF